jgi:hypothetical protein
MDTELRGQIIFLVIAHIPRSKPVEGEREREHTHMQNTGYQSNTESKTTGSMKHEQESMIRVKRISMQNTVKIFNVLRGHLQRPSSYPHPR